MNIKMLNFLTEMKELTGNSFVYEYQLWQMEHRDEPKEIHRISGNMNGFSAVDKDTLEELIDSFELIRSKTKLLAQAKVIDEKLACKLIKGTYDDII